MDYISVSELPVDIFEVTPETDKIISQLGTLPLHIRQSPSGANLSEIYSDVNSINLTVIKHQTDQSAQSDTSPASPAPSEELSVKTLANMFDFRLSDPSMNKNLHKLIRESKLDPKYSPPIDVKTCSEC